MSEFAAGPVARPSFSSPDRRDAVNAPKKGKSASRRPAPPEHRAAAEEPEEETRHQLDVKG